MSYLKILNINNLGQGSSLIHKLHPYNKFCLLVLNIFLVFQFTGKELVIYVVLLLVIMLSTCISFKNLLKILGLLLLTMIGFVIMIVLLNYNHKLLLLSKIYIKILSMVLPLVFYSLTTPLKQSIYTFEMILEPLKHLKINTNIVNLVLNIILTYIPLLLQEFDNVFLIKATKGEDIKNVSWFKKIKIIYNSLFVVIVNSYLKANELVNAILVRQFKFNEQRSRFVIYKMKKRDIFIMIILIAGFILI